jgi:hypothetical protein
MKNKTIFWIVISFIILNIIDLVTALKIGPAETNPIYLLFNSFAPLILIKIILVVLVYIIYHYNYYQSRYLFYIYIFILLEGIILLGYGIYTNISALLDPQIIQIAATIPPQVKVKQYFSLFKYFYLFPLVISSITFAIYRKHENNVKYLKDLKKDKKLKYM